MDKLFCVSMLCMGIILSRPANKVDNAMLPPAGEVLQGGCTLCNSGNETCHAEESRPHRACGLVSPREKHFREKDDFTPCLRAKGLAASSSHDARSVITVLLNIVAAFYVALPSKAFATTATIMHMCVI
mmetsp:Transcript_27216/g.75836  ORF Transcript_27216/g.75836 Transcript_27216/m.75836 type:complete len:129 (+) Transcript_27216:49-435(+)|eukprot:CAMPEP_0117585230 /NCGR_PEP_ID=MMETSP0784-20121206/68031_1 /TAXON_ID=39447 /ORGANISM="" /LENGTH=128 /DNA_ID=CAMNT_0005386157 /DNA_START=49 /DNA_END=435 /DNA_ORIENTATION=-